jgi:hypothetical protein
MIVGRRDLRMVLLAGPTAGFAVHDHWFGDDARHM